MGQVHLARHTGEHGIQRVVALKRILVHLTGRPGLVDLFLDEVRIAAQLNHGNIVQVSDHGVIDGQYFMAMEYIHGENLLEVLRRVSARREYLPLEILLFIACCLCEALDYAHGKEGLEGQPLGIVHRDISPQNVLLSFQGEVKLADFGVARAAEQSHETLGGELRGKVAYMSPEQAYGRPLDHRSDLFSLGIVLFEALSNRRLFQRENAMATLEAVRAAEVPRLADLRPDLPPELVEVVHWALGATAEQRPGSAREMHEAFQRVVRLNHLVASSFDLTDYLRELFPECAQGDHEAAGAPTEVGRRADDTVDLEQRTVCYLRRRHPGQEPMAHLPAGPAETPPPRIPARRVWPFVGAVAGMVLLAAVGGLLLSRNQPSTTSTATPAREAGAHAGARDALPSGLRSSTAGDSGGEVSRPPASATLAVRSVPAGAVVTANGQRLPGMTPLAQSFPAGKLLCTVSLKGHRSWRGTVELRDGRTYPLEVKLEPHPGLLTVHSTQRCLVKIDGRPIGETPIVDRPVSPGAQAVGCHDATSGARDVRRIRVAPGESTRVTFSFGVLAINLEPWAEVTVDGTKRGTTPLRLVLAEGEHRVVLLNRERGDLRRSLNVAISAARPTRVSSW
jgi:serine/threonine-protein kinase